jgi:hypothetical protein
LEINHISGFMALLKTTLEIPDPLFRRLKVSAASQGKTIRALVNEALVEKLNRGTGDSKVPPGWRSAFGGMRRYRKATARINHAIASEFSSIDPEDWK